MSTTTTRGLFPHTRQGLHFVCAAADSAQCVIIELEPIELTSARYWLDFPDISAEYCIWKRRSYACRCSPVLCCSSQFAYNPKVVCQDGQAWWIELKPCITARHCLGPAYIYISIYLFASKQNSIYIRSSCCCGSTWPSGITTLWSK